MRRMLSAILTGALLCTSLYGCSGSKKESQTDSRGGEISAMAAGENEVTTPEAGRISDYNGPGLWSVGFGSAELIPDDYDPASDSFGSAYYVAGYRNDNVATGMLDPQYARAAYISDNNGNAIVVASVDCVGMSKSFIDEIKAGLSDIVRQYRLTAIHIASTHTHAGIDTLGLWGPVGQDGKNTAFMEKVKLGTCEAIRLACESARDGSLYYGKADTGDLQRDSRLPHVYDTYVHRIRFEPADGSPGLQIINYGAHAESLRSQNSKVSADFPCYMGRKIKAETGDDYMFFAGAVGGLIMTEMQKDATGAEYPVEQNVVVTGERLAGHVLSIEDEIKLEPRIIDRTYIIKVNLDNKVYILLSSLGVLDAKPVPGGGSYGLALETQASLLSLGGLNIALVPGELFPELAYGGSKGDNIAFEQAANPDAEPYRTLVEITGDPNLLVWGLCDDEVGYIVAPNDFLLDADNPYFTEAYDVFGRKHYEETNSVGIEMYYRLAEAFEALVKRGNS